jgi:carbamoyltransferase
MPVSILGISAYYHDSAAALIVDGKIVAAAQEERFTRRKHDPAFPINAARYVLTDGCIDFNRLEAVAFYDKPYIKFERLLETYHAFAPAGLASFASAIPVWIKEKIFMKRMLRQELARLGSRNVPLFFPEHHLSHAASAFYPSPFEESAILTVDGVGEWSTTAIGQGRGNSLTLLKELHFPHSLGLLYSAFTYYLGFKVNSGEYKLMGLAPYGDPDSSQTGHFRQLILDNLVDIRDDGSLLLNMDYFRYATGLTMTDNRRWRKLFGLPQRPAESAITREHMNLALAIQQVTEEIVVRLARTAQTLTKSEYLTMAGGVALNCVANGKLLREGVFKDIWIQPAAGDAGGAIGAALAIWHIGRGQPRTVTPGSDAMQGSLLGPSFQRPDIQKVINSHGARARHFSDPQRLAETIAQHLCQGKVVGWFQGRMEFGPRALGGRSIIGDARNPQMQKKMNLKIKFRESFRPFAPAVLAEDVQTAFELDRPSPYMLLVAPVRESIRKPVPQARESDELFDRLYHERSSLPAVTHVDYSARVQSVERQTNPRFWQLLSEFKKLTGCSTLINTSFNVRGEPIVCTPEDAYRCFMRTEIDFLVVDDFLFAKSEQPALDGDSDWKQEFTLD